MTRNIHHYRQAGRRGAPTLCLLAGSALLLAATGTQAANCGISTTPSPATIDAGQSVAFNGTVSGKRPKTFDWTFNGGSPANSTQPSVTVTYASAGNFEARLDGSNGKGETCFATVTVQVNAVGNARPVAQNDEYNTQQATQLVVAAPGVLGNDNDPDGDPMTAVLVADVANGTLLLNGNGSFTYDPDPLFTGQDSFTYTANDAGGGRPTTRS